MPASTATSWPSDWPPRSTARSCATRGARWSDARSRPGSIPLDRVRLATLPGQPPPDAPLVCLDTETTGLATAAGTVAFLVGLGWWVGDTFRQVQLLLPDHGDEAGPARDAGVAPAARRLARDLQRPRLRLAAARRPLPDERTAGAGPRRPPRPPADRPPDVPPPAGGCPAAVRRGGPARPAPPRRRRRLGDPGPLPRVPARRPRRAARRGRPPQRPGRPLAGPPARRPRDRLRDRGRTADRAGRRPGRPRPGVRAGGPARRIAGLPRCGPGRRPGGPGALAGAPGPGGPVAAASTA